MYGSSPSWGTGEPITRATLLSAILPRILSTMMKYGKKKQILLSATNVYIIPLMLLALVGPQLAYAANEGSYKYWLQTWESRSINVLQKTYKRHGAYEKEIS